VRCDARERALHRIQNVEARGHSSATRRLARSLLWPLLRFFDPRFQGLSEQISEQVGAAHQDVVQRIEASRAEVDALRGLLEQAQTSFRQTEVALLTAITDLRRTVEAAMDADSELATIIGRSLTDLLGEVESLRLRLDALDPEAAHPRSS
jgi:hypothetical protein